MGCLCRGNKFNRWRLMVGERGKTAGLGKSGLESRLDVVVVDGAAIEVVFCVRTIAGWW